MSIRILTDSAADFTAKERAAYNLSFVPLQVIFGGETFLAGQTLSRDEFWARLLAGENPTTSQPSPEAFLHVFEDAKDAGDEVLYIALSSALSGTIQSAMIAASMADYDGIHIVDSLSATIGQKLLTLAACRMREEGTPCAAEIAQEITKLRSRLRVFANVDTLEYLARGGRLSKAAGAIGTLAQLKPQIMINDEGKVEVIGKAIGRHRAIDALVKKAASFSVDTAHPVIPVYSYDKENTEAFMSKLENAGIRADASLLTDLGPAIGTHIGPNAYGLAFIEEA